MAYLEPLNLRAIFVNYFAGSIEIFYFIAVILFSYLAARFRMPLQVYLVFMIVFVIFLSPFYNLFFVLTMLCVAGLIFYILSKIVKH